jgi:hypothetical protein
MVVHNHKVEKSKLGDPPTELLALFYKAIRFSQTCGIPTTISELTERNIEDRSVKRPLRLLQKLNNA